MSTAVAAPPALAEIRTEDLVKSFGPRTVVDGINLRFTAG